MHTTIHPVLSPVRRATGSNVSERFRQPQYETEEQRHAMKLVVYVPGVSATGVEIEARSGDLKVTARKSHVVRVNFAALHLETAQSDYQLRLRLGSRFDYAAMEAEISDGVLTITLPKRSPATLRRLEHAA